MVFVASPDFVLSFQTPALKILSGGGQQAYLKAHQVTAI